MQYQGCKSVPGQSIATVDVDDPTFHAFTFWTSYVSKRKPVRPNAI